MSESAAPASWRSWLRPVLMLALLVAAAWMAREFGLSASLRAPGRLGTAGFVLIGASGCAVGLPRQLVAFAAGLAHGMWPALGIAMLVQLLGCAADLAFARLLARRWVQARLAGRFGSRLARLEDFLRAHPFSATLTLRLLPVGSNVVLNLLAGALGVPVLPFLAASALGYLPQTLVFVLVGGGAHVAQGMQLAMAGVLFMVSLGTGLVLLSRHRVQKLAGAEAGGLRTPPGASPANPIVQ